MIEKIVGTLRESALELLKEEGQSAAEKTQAGMALIALELLGCFLVDVRRIADAVEVFTHNDVLAKRAKGEV